jgi:hypothetical protein
VRNSGELWLASRYRIVMHSTNMARQCKFVQKIQLFALRSSRTATEVVLRKLDVLILSRVSERNQKESLLPCVRCIVGDRSALYRACLTACLRNYQFFSVNLESKA